MSLSYSSKNGYIELPAADFDPKLTFECGQCFRYYERGGAYTGVAKNRVITVRREGDSVLLDCFEDEFLSVWANYFDMNNDYAAALERVSADPFTAAAAQYGRGIRILRQDFWEALCSFIISACNNITRIRSIVARLCEMYGDEIIHKGEVLHTFPSAERIAALGVTDLAPLRAGYRAGYIIAAAKMVASGEISEADIAKLDTPDAVKELTKIPGVGKKVANCALLYSIGKRDAFPIDTWIRKALDAHYPPGFDGSAFGADAGLAQQYIFHYIRSFPNDSKAGTTKR